MRVRRGVELVKVAVSVGWHPAAELMPAHLRRRVHHVDIDIGGIVYRTNATDEAQAIALAAQARQALGLVDRADGWSNLYTGIRPLPASAYAIRRCESCGKPENDHDVRHPFVGPGGT